MVGSPKGAGIRKNLDAYYADKSRKPYIVCESKDIDLNIKAAMKGLGISLLPQYYLNNEKIGPYCAEIDDPETAAVIGLSYN